MMTVLTAIKRLPRTVLLALLRAYRFLLSPWVGNSCRFWPTCSMYAMDAIERHGALKGSYMMVTRVARCHPYSAGGVDEVPAQFRWRCWCKADAPAGGPGAATLSGAGAVPADAPTKAPAQTQSQVQSQMRPHASGAAAALTLQRHTNEV